MTMANPFAGLNEHAAQLKMRGACHLAVQFANQYETPQAAWDACDNFEWMNWLLISMRYRGVTREMACRLLEQADRMAKRGDSLPELLRRARVQYEQTYYESSAEYAADAISLIDPDIRKSKLLTDTLRAIVPAVPLEDLPRRHP